MNLLTATMVGEDFLIFSMDKEKGVFGFLNSDIAFNAFVFVGLGCTVFGNCGYIISLLFYDPLVVSSTLLFEPFLAQFLGYLFGIDNFPGIFTFIGAFTIIAGIIQIDRGSRIKHSKIEERLENRGI